ncbi:redoxin domain-containing protein [Roseivirga misakiensis]|uniref:Thioredoxin domain-containing protein n=1 Tax=Roseivirga misakiensis TaxID=1563681 RepID=A0A1E5SZC5_9BACT|nr:redoxin domain-containing protein [Roseivirga misakiensis]OEK04484.1 hypothetical protein BFP71_13520 [Roseivirga misakiensis]
MKLKAIIILALILVSGLLRGQALTVGDNIDHLEELEVDLIGPKNGKTTNGFPKKKVILIDFWATWCGSCIVNMPHLDSLQKEFKDDLLVLAVSTEDKARLERFAAKRPYSFMYARDREHKMSDYFPYRMLPHSVLIDVDGTVVAITNPSNINKEVIKKVINKEKIDLPLKVDNTAFDYAADYFNLPADAIETFDIQPYNPNIPGFTKYNKDGRRISMHNTTITGMYRQAFDMSSFRLELQIDEAKVDWKNTDNRYNLDILVAPEDAGRLNEIFQEKLLSTLDIKAKTKKKEMEVIVVSKIDSIPFPLEKAGTDVKNLNSRGDRFISNRSSMDDFTKYLEDQGTLGKPVVNETGIDGLFVFDFSYDPENPQSFHDAIKKMGIKMKKEMREIDILVIYEED